MDYGSKSWNKNTLRVRIAYHQAIVSDTADGSEIMHQLRLVVYPIIFGVLYIPGGCLGFLPSTVLILGCFPTQMQRGHCFAVKSACFW